MRTLNRNPWIASLFLLAAASGSITVAGAGLPATQANPPQQQQQQQIEERQKALEKILQEMQKSGSPDQQVVERLLQAMQKNLPGQQPPPAPAAAQSPAPTSSIVPATPASGGPVRLNFDNFSLFDFVNNVADMLNITPVLIDPDVKGTVNFHSRDAISMQDFFPIFSLILKSNNAALVKSGTVYRIVPISQGLKEGLELVVTMPPPPPAPAEKEVIKKDANPAEAARLPATAGPPGQASVLAQAAPTPGQPPVTRQVQAAPATPDVPRLATHVIRVELVPVQTLIEPIKLFMTDGGVIMPYERLNMLIVTDYTDNVKKLMEIIELLDSTYIDSDLIELIEIKYNYSADVLEDLKKIFGDGTKDSATGVYMVSLDRMNTILVMANSKRALEEVKRWVAKLDTTTGRSVQTFIYTVENGTASNIAQVLALLFGSGDVSTQGGAQAPGAATPMGGLGSTGQRGGTGGGSTLSGSQAGRNQFTSAVPGNNQFMGGSQGMGNLYGQGAGMGLMGGQQSIGGMRLTQGAGMTAQVLTASSFSGLQGNVRIVADDINNALIIQGSAADYDFLLETIKRMDVLPRQAIIDARIFEIDLTDGLSFGVSAALQATTSGQHLTTGSVGGDTGALSASTFAFVGSAREILMNLSALQQKTKVRILEAPSVLAVDGRTAHIQVGGSVPIPGASYVPAQGGITTSVQYAETGTTLEITPRISGSGTVTLEIAQAVTVPGASSDLGPTFSTTNVYTTLAVKDGESVAIAGLIRESDSNTRNGVPFLSSIPLMGALFGRTTRSSARTELLIMITPHVIKNPDRFREMTQKLKDSVSMAGKFADQKEAEIRENEEKARQKRLEQEQKQIKKSGQQPDQPPAKKVEAPAAGK